jgi:hypothetical protein
MCCEIKNGITHCRRQLRWVLDHRENGNVGDCTEILSQAYNSLRNIELVCLSRQNEKNSVCVLKEQNSE